MSKRIFLDEYTYAYLTKKKNKLSSFVLSRIPKNIKKAEQFLFRFFESEKFI